MGLPKKDLNQGGRGISAFCRPFPILTPGTPKTLSFDIRTKLFTYSFTRSLSEDGSWDGEGQNYSTEIFLPKYNFPHPDEIDVWVSCGTYEIHHEKQRLVWTCRESVDILSSARTSSSIDSSSALRHNRSRTHDTRVHSEDIITHRIVIQKRSGSVLDPKMVTDEE